MKRRHMGLPLHGRGIEDALRPAPVRSSRLPFEVKTSDWNEGDGIPMHWLVQAASYAAVTGFPFVSFGIIDTRGSA
jgi:hypothetical protein